VPEGTCVKKLKKVQKPLQVYRRFSEGEEGLPEGTQKEKGREGEGEGVVILLMWGSRHSPYHEITRDYGHRVQPPLGSLLVE
jgi:hypothetical protein